MKDFLLRKCYILLASTLVLIVVLGIIIIYQYSQIDKIAPQNLGSFLEKSQYFVAFSFVLLMAWVVTLFHYFRKNFLYPLLDIHQQVMVLGKGELPQADANISQPVLRAINEQLNFIGLRSVQIADFLQEISTGNPESEFVLLSQKDYLGKALLKFLRTWQQQKHECDEKIKEHKTEVRYCKAQMEKQAQESQAIMLQKEEKLRLAYEKLIEAGNELRQNAEKILDMNRNLAIAKKELENKNAELIDINQEKNHLIGVVAHDLRNPLASSICVIDLLAEESQNLNEDQLEYVQVIKNALARMNSMINQILDIKMIEQKRINLHLENIDLQEILDQIHDDFLNLAAQKNIRLHLQSSPANAILDRNYTLQILENLISNAIKFSPPYKNIYIRLFEQAHQVRIEVQDEGAGISAEDMSKLFGKFQRLSAQPTAGEKSTGLGLSIVKKYVEAMKGQVWCESELGKGANFIVCFEKNLYQKDL